MKKGPMIEKDSFALIGKEMKREFDPFHLPIVKRIIHATGDFQFEDTIRFHPDAVKSGVEAIRRGLDIVVDVKMVAAGINQKALSKFGGNVVCRISDEEVEETAMKFSLTRAEAAFELILSEGCASNIGIIAIGNAPTALIKTMEIIDAGRFSPALVIGVPVGFVKAEESKDMLSQKNYPFITCLGKKGGSPVAAAIINALIILACENK
ncbi:MAG: precorrin-8X methylmutase [Nitrospirae bacterium]|nr:precorrin-8X methylmutase [Nitrospirota bacterium]MBF0533888.1 precorrin-8X methylmutase [Nitrospirota bacterium]MBF0615403.1 precorrin-8X methylmutase [Nitrospirota bacterium]